MINDSMISEILAKRRDRAIAVILSVKERDCDPHLPNDARAKLRKTVLDQLNDFYDLALDLLRSAESTDGIVVNDLYLQKLDRIHEEMGAIKTLLEAVP